MFTIELNIVVLLSLALITAGILVSIETGNRLNREGSDSIWVRTMLQVGRLAGLLLILCAVAYLVNHQPT